jgi:hypothetical protein
MALLDQQVRKEPQALLVKGVLELQDFRVTLDLRVFRVIQGLECKVTLDLKALRVIQVLRVLQERGYRAIQDLRDCRVTRDHKALQVIQDRKVLQVTRVSRVTQGLRAIQAWAFREVLVLKA